MEYCSPEKCIEREDFYLSSENNEYNIANKAGAPMFGRNHSDESKKIMSEAKKGIKGENHPMFGKTHSSETCKKISDAMPNSIKISVTDIKKNTTTYYDSICEAARALNLPSHQAITNYIKNNQQKPYKGKYIFKKVN
jgi:group I intron endonuclease